MRSFSNGTTALVAGTWVSGYIEVNAGGTQADLYVNGSATPEATVSSGLPTGPMLLGAAMLRIAGSGVRTQDLDYLGPPQVTFSSPR